MAVGNAPVPASGAQPAAPTPAAGTPAASTTPAPPAPPASAAPAHNNSRWDRVATGGTVALVVVCFALGYLFGTITWDHRRAAWHVGWGLIFAAFALLVRLAIDERRNPTAPCPGAAAPPAPPASAAPAPPATPPAPTACALTVGVWTDVGGHQLLQDASGVLWRNDPTNGVVRVT